MPADGQLYHRLVIVYMYWATALLATTCTMTTVFAATGNENTVENYFGGTGCCLIRVDDTTASDAKCRAGQICCKATTHTSYSQSYCASNRAYVTGFSCSWDSSDTSQWKASSLANGACKVGAASTQVDSSAVASIVKKDEISGRLDAGIKLSGATQLTSLSIIDACSISGTIPPEINKLLQLSVLHIQRDNTCTTPSASRLSGVLPAALADLTRLTSLQVSGTQLKITGVIPTALAKLTKLTSLTLSGIGLSGTLSLPSLSGFVSLTSLEVPPTVKLSGLIPSELGLVSKNDPAVKTGSFSITADYVRLPDDPTQVADFFGGTGCCPVREGTINMATNAVCQAGQICCTATGASYSQTICNNDKPYMKYFGCTWDATAGKCKVGTTRKVGFPTALSLGEFDGIKGKLEDALVLAGAHKLTSLELKNVFKLSGTIPTDIAKLTDLRSFTLGISSINAADATTKRGQFRISGTLPKELGKLAKLTRLSIESKYISGKPDFADQTLVGATPLPQLQSLSISSEDGSRALSGSIGNLHLLLSNNNLRSVKLSALQLAGELSWTPPSRRRRRRRTLLAGASGTGIAFSTNMEALEISDRPSSSSRMEGSIPFSIGRMTKLTSLKITSAVKLSGTIPTSIEKLTALKHLEISDAAKLVGSIPAGVFALSFLTTLTLYDNKLDSELPQSSLEKLSRLQGLHLSKTKISGSIPFAIGFLPELVQFEFYETRLSGAIPDFLRDTKIQVFGKKDSPSAFLVGPSFTTPDCTAAAVQARAVNGAASGDKVCTYINAVNCLAGKYGTRAGCQNCQAGHYQDEATTAGAACKQCQGTGFRKYQDETGKTTCKSCPLGSVAVLGSTCACSNPCPKGKYLLIGSTSQACALCPDGKYLPIQGSIDVNECSPCEAGRYGQTNRESCIACGSGRYNSGTARTSSAACIGCGAGRYSAAVGANSGNTCASCAAGTYSTTTGAAAISTCIPCATGRYNPSPGSTNSGACIACGAGRYSVAAGANTGDACAHCVTGKYSSAVGATSPGTCIGCPTGTHGAVGGARTASTTACASCAPGNYQDTTGQLLCKSCGRGKYNNQHSGVSETAFCKSCSPGFYSAAIGAAALATCTECSVGRYGNSAGATAASNCNLCGPGKANPLSGQSLSSACISCAGGRYQAGSGKAFCDSCDAGKYSTQTGQSAANVCQDCSAGKYSSARGLSRSADCSSCPLGQFGAPAGANSLGACTDCPALKYGIKAGQGAESDGCSPCPSGTFQNEAGRASCKPASCPSGRWGSMPPDCTDCVAGKYYPAPGIGSPDKCLACPTGRYGTTPGATALDDCALCKAGSFGNTSGVVSADCSGLCLPGKFSNADGLTECSQCQIGIGFTDLPGQAACKSAICKAGTYGSASAVDVGPDCRPCAVGRFSAVRGLMKSSDCSSCPLGQFGIGQGLTSLQTACRLCPAQKYGVRRGQASESLGCLDCPRGYYNLEQGAAACSPSDCAKGKYGSTEPHCASCPAGTFSEAIGAGSRSQCNDCPLGRWSSEIASASLTYCKICPNGTFGSASGLTNSSCSGTCPPGQYSQLGWTQCIACGRGRYATNPGQPECKNCGAGETSSEGAAECVCEARRYRRELGGPCIGCPDGISCAKAGTTIESAEVQPGYWRSSSTSSMFLQCPIKGTCLGTPVTSTTNQNGSTTNSSSSISSSGNSSLLCKEGQEGVLCAVCSPKYTRWRSQQPCTKCPDDIGPAIGQSVGFLALGAFLMILLLLFNRKAQNAVMRPLIHTSQMICVVLMFWSEWPASFQWLADVFSSINLDFISLVSPTCLGLRLNFYYRYVTNVVCSILLILFIWFTARCRVKQEYRTARHRDVFLFVLLLHPIISGQSFYVFRCQKVGDVHYLMEDYSLECYDGMWWGMAIFALSVIVVFSFGCPASLALMLYRRRALLFDPNVYRVIGIIYTPYKPACYYYESINMTFKLLLWATLVFFDKGSQFSLAVVVVIAFLHIQFHTRLEPYKRPFENILQHLGLLVIMLMALAGLVLNYLKATEQFYKVKQDLQGQEDMQTKLGLFKVLSAIAVYAVASVMGIRVLFKVLPYCVKVGKATKQVPERAGQVVRSLSRGASAMRLRRQSSWLSRNNANVHPATPAGEDEESASGSGTARIEVGGNFSAPGAKVDDGIVVGAENESKSSSPRSQSPNGKAGAKSSQTISRLKHSSSWTDNPMSEASLHERRLSMTMDETKKREETPQAAAAKPDRDFTRRSKTFMGSKSHAAARQKDRRRRFGGLEPVAKKGAAANIKDSSSSTAVSVGAYADASIAAMMKPPVGDGGVDGDHADNSWQNNPMSFLSLRQRAESTTFDDSATASVAPSLPGQACDAGKGHHREASDHSEGDHHDDDDDDMHGSDVEL